MRKNIFRIQLLVAVLMLISTACQRSSTPTLQSTPTVVVIEATQTLIPPISAEPAAGICAEVKGELAVAEIYPDIPSPRCLKVNGEQKLKVINRTEITLNVEFGEYQTEVPPGGEDTFNTPFGDYLAPGVHRVEASPYGGPEIWLIE